MENNDQWCFIWMPGADDSTGDNRQALLSNAKWRTGSRITISFLDGDPKLHTRVKEVAREWVAPDMARLTFDFPKNTTDTDIRISFRYAGSWSAIGTTCRQIRDRSQPTMNFGWLKADSPKEELRRVVLHEFGHALGLIHEHQVPDGGIKWNRDEVIRDLSGPPNNWKSAMIEQNMFAPYGKSETNYTKLDRDSIMMYPLPRKWTTNGFSVGLNSELSPADRKFIRKQYQ